MKAETLRALHVPGKPLIVPNAWDAASARMVEEAGFPAVATSSFAMATIHGYGDGELMPVADVLAAVAHITRAVDIPVTVDFERGYGLDPAELVKRFLDTGAVGLNLEDSDPRTGSMIEAGEQADFLAAVRAAAQSNLVINARTDSFLRNAGSAAAQLEASVERGNRYLAAGADCVYPIGTGDAEVIRALTERIDGPVNVAFGGGERPVGEFAALGVARVSFGPMLQRQLYARFASVMLPALTAGTNPFVS
ncbi:isocitrate lyase/phosphoenolpyruvate mutase family protein [Kribbella albertanoniae]|uniref:Isocitrate lyase/phosphoenolpyruvate mutase family protein n=1 Tax=Kribbella albertanoniae TaxID=1266829 RepID=A0A4R4Q2D7_9ACTN|nr:isocitrate lyase/phosphoenolpyruvate mutase family protein [Kribbella albertanoniae]TDC29166.1 isocitrate lyase/phosphoenolpyruvate mutase family protein [Kribbella albertanoniae]